MARPCGSRFLARSLTWLSRGMACQQVYREPDDDEAFLEGVAACHALRRGTKIHYRITSSPAQESVDLRMGERYPCFGRGGGIRLDD